MIYFAIISRFGNSYWHLRNASPMRHSPDKLPVLEVESRLEIDEEHSVTTPFYSADGRDHLIFLL